MESNKKYEIEACSVVKHYFCVVVSAERTIIETLLDCSMQELNFVIHNMNLKLLVYRVRNHNIPSLLPILETVTKNRSRSRLLDVLSRQRVSDLTVSSKVVLLDTIQLLRLTSDSDISKEAEQSIARLVLSTETEQLSILKTLMVCF